MATRDRETAFRYVNEQLNNQGNLGVLDEAFAPEYLARHKQHIVETVNAFRAAFPDWQVAIDEVVTHGDELVFRSTGRGTHRSSGKQVEVPQVGVVRFEGDKVVESWGSEEPEKLLDQADVQGYVLMPLATHTPAQLTRTLKPG